MAVGRSSVLGQDAHHHNAWISPIDAGMRSFIPLAKG